MKILTIIQFVIFFFIIFMGTALLTASEKPEVSLPVALPAAPGTDEADYSVLQEDTKEKPTKTDETNDEEKENEEDEEESGLQWQGCLSAGYYANTSGAHWNGNIANNPRSGGSLNALYLKATRTADTEEKESDWGFGMDFLFGEETQLLRAVNGMDKNWYTGHDGAGNPSYGFAMPQLYGDLAVQDWTVRMGYFYTPIGYESPFSAERFFYTSGLGYSATPTSHTGTTLTWSGLEKFSATVGWIAGCNQAFDNSDNGSMILGSFSYDPNEKASLSYSFIAGNQMNHLHPYAEINRVTGSIHSWIIDLTPDENWNIAFNSDYYDFNGDEEYNQVIFGTHIYRTINQSWKWGVRTEWQRLRNYIEPSDKEWTSLTVGAHWAPRGNERITFRPEIRYDHASSPLYGRGNEKKDQICLGFDMLYTF